MGDGGTKQIGLNLSKQRTGKQGWEAAELAPRVAVRRWLQHRAGVEVHDMRPPTRVAGREELQGVVPLPLDFSVDVALREAAWLADGAYSVITTRMGLAVRVLAADLEEIRKLVQPELQQVSGTDAVTDFLIPVRIFRQGYRRTWVVRAAEQPMSTTFQDDFGLAVIKRATTQKTRQELELQKWTSAAEQVKTAREAIFPQTWAAVAVAPIPQRVQQARGQKRTAELYGHPCQARQRT